MQAITRSTTITVRQHLAAVMVVGYFYAVDLGDPVRPQHHRVGLNGECTCPLGRQCPAVTAVREYLADGGQRAERPPFGYYPVRPAKCPVCHKEAATDTSLSSRNRGEGWVCPSGKGHYWQHRAHISAMRIKLKGQGKIIV
jgi:hypothetical protein